MSIKIDNEAKQDLSKLLEWVNGGRPETLLQYQEIIVNIIRLLTNIEFRKDIDRLRNELRIPGEFLTSKDDYIGEKWLDWIEENPKDRPLLNDHQTVVYICRKYNLDPRRYGEFIIDYLYFGNPSPSIPAPHNDIFSKDEFMHKARIETDSPEFPTVGYIRFFGDTTIHGLHEFINKNLLVISRIQRSLAKYPKSKITNRAKNFERNLLIFLLKTQGYKSSQIQRFLTEKYPNESKTSFIPDESNIRKIISEIKKLINQVA